MTSAMNYKGYAARIEYSDEDDAFVGHIAGINDIVGFHADNVADLRAAFKDAVDDYLDMCAKIGKQPQKSYSGKMMLRMKPEAHYQASVAAELAGKSLNQWAEDVFVEATKKLAAGSKKQAA